MTVRRRPIEAQIFAWGAAAAAIVGFTFSALYRPTFTDRSAILFALLVLLTALAWRYPVEFAPKVKVYVTSAPTFAAPILLPLAMAAAAAALRAPTGHAPNRQPVF